MKRVNLIAGIVVPVFLLVIAASSVYSQGDGKYISSRDRIPNRYIVVLQDEPEFLPSFPDFQDDRLQVREKAEMLSKEYGGRINRLYGILVKGYAVEMTEFQARELSRDRRVKFVEEDFVVTLNETQANPPSWGLDRIDQRNLPTDSAYTYTTDGTGVHVYVIDSGIKATHTEFTGRLGNGTDLANDGQGTNDCYGHGTHVAGTIGGTTYGVAKNVTLHPVRVFNCQGQSSGSGSVGGMEWVAANRIMPAVVNMSLGGSFSPVSNAAVANLVSKGIHVVVSAGNDNLDACKISPASAPGAITVGSILRTDVRAASSNFGVCLDVFARGDRSSRQVSVPILLFPQGREHPWLPRM